MKSVSLAQDLTVNKSQRIKRSHTRVSCSISFYNVFCLNDQSSYSRKRHAENKLTFKVYPFYQAQNDDHKLQAQSSLNVPELC